MQLLIYYVSQAFQGAEAKYPQINKIAFALIVPSWKLRLYFQANPILMMMDQPIKKSVNKFEAARRMIQWAIEFTILDKDGALDEAEKWTIQINGSSA